MTYSILSVVPLFLLPAPAAMSYGRVLNICGPGGPLGPMKEWGKIFSQAEGVPCYITTGPSPQRIEKARENGDIIVGEAEYMLTDFPGTYPGIVDETTGTSPDGRSTGIIAFLNGDEGHRIFEKKDGSKLS